MQRIVNEERGQPKRDFCLMRSKPPDPTTATAMRIAICAPKKRAAMSRGEMTTLKEICQASRVLAE